jgi:hypothetical protein
MLGKQKAPPVKFSEVLARRQAAAEGSGIGFVAADRLRARCRFIKRVGHLDLVEWLDPPFNEHNPSLVFGFCTHKTLRATNVDACPEFGPHFEIAVEAFATKSGACKSASQSERKLALAGIPVAVYLPNEPFWGRLIRVKGVWKVEPITASQALHVYRRLIDINASCPNCRGVSGNTCDLCHSKGFVIPLSESEAVATCPRGVRWGSLSHVEHERARKSALTKGQTNLVSSSVSHIMENLAR